MENMIIYGKNAIIEALNNAGIIELFEENKFYGRFLWGTEVWFRCNSKEYLWIVDWNGKDIIQMKDGTNIMGIL